MTNATFKTYLEHAGLSEKPYQVEGVKWCLAREKLGFNACGKVVRGGLLADEMGLGKTIQIIGTMIENLKPKTLIVLPRALLEQWQSVILKTLGHEAMIYHSSRGTPVSQINDEELTKAPITITTYGMVNQEPEALHGQKWDRVIFDEAHHLRNMKTSAFKGAKKLDADIKWLVTGTPIQNKLSDFYSLCNVMGIPEEFYTEPDNLITIANQFLLKRTKSEVNLDIPSLNTQIIETEWASEEERELAEDIHSQLAFSGCGSVTAKMSGLNEHVLPLMIHARQTCILPALLKKHVDRMIEDGDLEDTPELRKALSSSSKIDQVVKTILERKDNQRGKLVFCHFRGEIDRIKSLLVEQNMNVETFDGRVSPNNRAQILTRKCDVLILQIKTGCEGLNLQQFSEIYFVSPHWNPAIEDQAVARCHRIGQEGEVDVFRFNMIGLSEDNEDTQTIDQYASNVQDMKRETMKTLHSDRNSNTTHPDTTLVTEPDIEVESLEDIPL